MPQHCTGQQHVSWGPTNNDGAVLFTYWLPRAPLTGGAHQKPVAIHSKPGANPKLAMSASEGWLATAVPGCSGSHCGQPLARTVSGRSVQAPAMAAARSALWELHLRGSIKPSWAALHARG